MSVSAGAECPDVVPSASAGWGGWLGEGCWCFSMVDTKGVGIGEVTAASDCTVAF